MFNQNSIEKLKQIITHLGLGRTKEIRNFFDNLKKQPPLDNLAIKQNLILFEELICNKAFDLINKRVICTDSYGLEFFNLIEEMEFKKIHSLLLEKGFESSLFNTLPTTQKFFNTKKNPVQPRIETRLEESPLDLSSTGPFALSKI